ncbi:MAG: UPF0280 family protein [Planctomycetes bacterium]|nr:UPF0280 family protein [Planctomycetota bacterium]
MDPGVFEPRFYRKWTGCGKLVGFNVQVEETDLAVKASVAARKYARELVIMHRAKLVGYANENPRFVTSMRPLETADDAPGVVRMMAEAAAAYDVGPMAAVAGAIAQLVGEGLLARMKESGVEAPEVIVENGGDCFIKTKAPAVVSLYAGPSSPFSGKLKIRIDSTRGPRGVCTSSGTVGHSTSFGKADAVVAVAASAALADAAATAICNAVKQPDDIQRALDAEKKRRKLQGLLVAMGEHLGAWGEIEIV